MMATVDKDIAASVARIARIDTSRIRRHRHQSMVEVDAPHLSRVMFDRQWMPDIPLICMDLGTCYYVAPLQMGQPGDLLVLVSQTMEFKPKFYDITFSTPLLMRMRVGSYWEKGVRLHLDLLHKETNAVLINSVRYIVKFDKKLGKVSPLSAQEQTHYDSIGSVYLPITRATAPQPPPDPFKCLIKPTASDYDLQRHVNQAVYIRYCLDAGYEATRQGALSSFPANVDPAVRRIETVLLTLKSEVFTGETLEVAVWEVDRFHLGFSIKKQGTGIGVCSASIKYYPWSSHL